MTSTTQTGMCPKCQTVRNFRVTLERREMTAEGGARQTIETSTAHCEVCGSFIARDSREIAAGQDQ